MKFALALMLGLMLIASTATAQGASATLTWTSTGDDGLIGTASGYDIRWSNVPITATNFTSATQWTTGVPVPLPPGTAQSVTMTGLPFGTTLYFAIKTRDESNNWSAISNVASKTTAPAPDVTRPAALALNPGAITDSSVVVAFNAVGNDSLTGTATSYDFRYSTAPITEANWASALQGTGEPAPALAGTAQTFKLNGLLRQTQYYIAAKTTDAAGNVSVLSNVMIITTTDTLAPSAVTTLSAS